VSPSANDDLPTPFGLAVHTLEADQVRIAVRGELDLATTTQLRQALDHELEAGRSTLLDLSEVDFIDSTGLAAIVGAVHRARQTGATFQVSSDLPSQAQRLLDLTGVLPLLSLVDVAPSGPAAAPTRSDQAQP
jgi:anti-sigma B factor antagonist